MTRNVTTRNIAPMRVRTLTKQQLDALRLAPAARRVALAIELADVTQAEVAAAVQLPQPYVSDVARRRYRTITVENAHKFA